SRPDPSPSGLRSSGLTLVNRVDPGDLLRLLDRFDVEIDDDRLVVAPYQYAFQRLVAGRVDLLVRHIGRHEDEIAGARLRDEFQLLAPTHARLAANYIDDALERTVMVCTGLGVGMNVHGACPDLLCADASEIDRGGAIHAWSARRVRIETVARNHLNAGMLPAVFGNRVSAVCFVRHRVLLCHCCAAGAAPTH